MDKVQLQLLCDLFIDTTFFWGLKIFFPSLLGKVQATKIAGFSPEKITVGVTLNSFCNSLLLKANNFFIVLTTIGGNNSVTEDNNCL